jgi:hypothetical protein
MFTKKSIFHVFSVLLVIVLLLASAGSARAASVAQSGCSVIYDVSNGWMVEMCATDPSVTTSMEVLVDGVSHGSAALVRVYHKTQSGSGVPQVAAIYASGYVRLKQNADPTPSIPFGTSFILGPAYWPNEVDYYHNPELTQLAIDTTWLPNAPLRMSAQGANHAFNVTYKMEMPPPRDRQTRLHVTQTYTATAAVTIDPTRQNDRQGFKLVQASSMYINEGGSCDGGYSDCHDSDGARFIGNDGVRHQVPFSGVTPNSFIFASHVPLGSTWLDVLHSDDLSWHSATGASGNTPNARIALDELPAGRTITPQGWLQTSTNPNDDNVGLWLNDDNSASWGIGESATVGYWLLAQDNPPDPPKDIDLPTGLTFLNFEGSHDCSKVFGAPATATDPVIINGYSNKALQMSYDLGSDNGNWVQISCHFDPPLDLSAYDHLRIDWRGSPATANSLQVGLVDGAGHNFFDRMAYYNVTEHAWWGQLIVPFNQFESSPAGTPFDPTNVSRVFISVFKDDTNGDTGGAGSIAIDNLNAFNVASRIVPPDFEVVDPANPVAAQAAASWLAAQQWSMGLLNSWEEHFENDHVCFASTYEQALALMVFADRGMWSNADKIVDALEAVQNPDGSWYQSYSAVYQDHSCNAPVTPNTSNKWEGDVTWTIFALGRYLALGGTHPQATIIQQKAADWLATRVNTVDPAKGCLVIESTEATIDAWWAFQAAGRMDDADKIKNCLLTYYWNDTMGRFMGGRNQFYLPYLDNQTWGGAFLKAIGENTKALRALSYARDVFRLPAQGGQLYGFDSNAGPWSIWNEGTATYIAAGGQGANDVLQELLAQQRQDGAMPGSPDEFNGGGTWATRWHGVAPTAWLYNALSNEPFVPALLAPADGAHLFHPTPTLDWGDGQDHYQVQIATASDFNAGSIVQDEIVHVSTYTPALPLADGLYYWRVRAFNAAGESKGWLFGVRSFTIATLKEINYYPKDHAWEKMWEEWPAAKIEMDQDLDRIAALGFNTVRIFLHPNVFGYLTPSHMPDSTQLGRFEEALALIDAHGLKAHVTLFDCWGDWGDIDGSKTWLTEIVVPHQNDSRIAIWELKNEVIFDPSKPDYQLIRDWFQALFPFLKAQAGNTPVTVSVYNVEWLADVKALAGATPPDIYSLHWYPDNFYSWTLAFPTVIDRARELIGQADLLIGEFGLSTYTYSDTVQADLTRDVLYYAHQKGITNVGFWTLNDFPPGTLICCALPEAEQWYYGLYRTDGTQKPAASILQAAFHGNPPSSLSPRRILNPSFEDLNPYSGYLDNWWPWDVNWTGHHWEDQDCTKAHTGNCSAKLHVPNGTDGPVGMTVGLRKAPPFLLIDPEQHYSLEGWVQTENLDGSACITFSWFDDQDTWISNTTTCVTDSDLTEWTPIRIIDAPPPSNAVYAEVFLQVSSNNPSSLVWFDDIKPIPLITFDPAPTPIYLGGNFTVNARTTNTDSTTLTYSAVSVPCALVGGATFSSSGAGECVVKADGVATTYFAAASKTQSVTIAKATPIITFGPAPTPTYPGSNFTVNATTTNTDSAALTYSRVSGPCALVSGATFSSSGAGICVVKADGAATTNFVAASKTQSVTIAAPAEMNVKGNGVSIVDGDITPSPTDCTNFGSTNVISGTVNCTYTIENLGGANLTLSGTPKVSISGANASDFSVTVQPTSPVAAGGSTTFTVRFDPSATGTRVVTISIANNDSNENPYNFVIQGTGYIPLERLKNGGFNTYPPASKIPTFWVKSATFAAIDGKDTITRKEGTASVKIVGAAGKVKTLTQTLTLSGVIGDTFTFTFWARGKSIPAAGLCQGQVLLYSGTTLKLTKTVPCSNGSYAAFQKKTLIFKATSAYTKVVIKFTYSKASGTVWFDAASLIE